MILSQFQPILNHLWQSTLFATAAGLLALVLKRYGPQARYVLWLAASAKFLVPFSLLTLAGGWLGRQTDVPVSPPISLVVQQLNEPFTWEPLVIPAPDFPTTASAERFPAKWISTALWAAWGLGCAFVVFHWLSGWRRVRSAMRAASPVDPLNGVPVFASPEILEPSIVGIFRPTLLLPQGIQAELTPSQLQAVLQHEMAHIHRRDNLTGLIHRAIEVLFWFHPLVWWIGARLIAAREQACDQEVLRSGVDPETYGEGILKICELYLKSPLPFVTGVTGSNLKTRVEQIMSRHVAPQLSVGRKAVLVSAGLGALAIPTVVGMLNVPILVAQTRTTSEPAPKTMPRPMAQVNSQPTSQPKPRSTFQTAAQAQPARQTTPTQRFWVPASEAPKDLLTPREVELHDRFIDRARAGNIDIVFFGSTAAEMWLWRDRGGSVWTQAFGRLKAANFGSQGSRFDSLLWRMQNGELDGYQAKIVVLHDSGTGDQVIGDRQADVLRGYASIIAEIRARQSQAKVLLTAAFPRGQLRHDEWVKVAEANALVYAKLVDNQTVFYTDIGDRFFRPDGSFNSETWNGGVGVGIQKPAYEVWAEALQPWLDRFVR